MRIEPMGIAEVQDIVRTRGSYALVLLFTGERLYCCDEAVAVKDDDGRTLGFATIAPDGEGGSGVPTIVGLYVIPEARKGAAGFNVGSVTFRAAIDRCVARGFELIHVDVLSSYAMRIIDKLPADLRLKLEMNLDGMGTLDSCVD